MQPEEVSVSKDQKKNKDLNPGERLLLGPGPSNVPDRVLRAMAAPCIGHLDPDFLAIMDETQQLLRFVFQTENSFTVPVSGTGSAGMETCFVNLIEPGDGVAVCINGVFGTRMADMVQRLGGRLIRIDAPWGRAVDPDRVRDSIKDKQVKILAVVHAETSTGVCQPLDELATIAHEAGALFLVDCVTSLGGLPVSMDIREIDAAYSGTQKCLSCPPGLSPLSFNSRALEVLEKRKTPVTSWYLDMTLVRSYWGQERKYHHTAPINMIYGLREALRLIYEEGLESRFARHLLNHRALVAGLEAMGLMMLVPEGERLASLNAVKIPAGVDDLKIRRALLSEFGIEIGGGLGELAGKIWRVGLMGHNSQKKNVLLFLSALETILKSEGVKVNPGAPGAASAVWSRDSL
jgi:alanine-glyoxylate transaminase/serine-glyoxylate transaminase/serine-pyruvate transaminase